jgi:hypothetical protein
MIFQAPMDKPPLLAHFRVNALLRIWFPETSAMWKTSSKLVSLAVAMLIALPAMAGDFGGSPFPRHHGGGHRGAGYQGSGFQGSGFQGSGQHGQLIIRHQGASVIGQSGGWNRGQMRFAGNHDGFRGKNPWRRGGFIQRFSSPSSSFARNNVLIINRTGQDQRQGGTYAGSSYAFEANGGTYIGANGYAIYGYRPTVRLAPMAKVITVSTRRNPCSYEAGVCVIRH